MNYVYIKYKLLIFKELEHKSPLLSFNSTDIHQEPEHCTLEDLSPCSLVLWTAIPGSRAYQTEHTSNQQITCDSEERTEKAGS